MERHETILSPVTEKDECRLACDLNTNVVINQYQEEQHIDVKRFFKGPLRLFECPATGYRFFYPPSSMGDGPFYEELESLCKGSYYPENKWEYSEALEFVKPGNSVLEI